LIRKRVRRSWSDEEKRSICAQTRVAGVSTAQVARRYALNANLIFNWLRDPRFQPDENQIDQAVFLPVEITGDDMSLPAPSADNAPQWQTGGNIVIELAGGHRVSVEGGYDGDALARLLKGLVS
jgi:transposase